MKEELKPMYSELQGYLSQAPVAEGPKDHINDEALWEQYNEAVDMISKITQKNFTRFHVYPSTSQYGDKFIRIATYRQKLGGLISHLHGEYFSDELPPFSGMPQTIISQSQQQAQSVTIQMVLEIHDKIHEKLPNYEEGSSEKKFLEKLKSMLGNVSNVTSLLSLCFSLAKEFGLGIESLAKLLS